MAGEYILKLMNGSNVRLVFERRGMYYSKGLFRVYEDIPYKRSPTMLLTTESEKKACKILKGE